MKNIFYYQTIGKIFILFMCYFFDIIYVLFSMSEATFISIL